PLAIEQAAAYVQHVTGDFTAFHEEYRKNHQEILKWIPEDNRPYSHSVATTWSMAFDLLNRNYPQSAKLLQLLSFLNPDGILIDFLIDGARALENSLQQVIST